MTAPRTLVFHFHSTEVVGPHFLLFHHLTLPTLLAHHAEHGAGVDSQPVNCVFGMPTDWQALALNNDRIANVDGRPGRNLNGAVADP